VKLWRSASIASRSENSIPKAIKAIKAICAIAARADAAVIRAALPSHGDSACDTSLPLSSCSCCSAPAEAEAALATAAPQWRRQWKPLELALA